VLLTLTHQQQLLQLHLQLLQYSSVGEAHRAAGAPTEAAGYSS
jgi:hypothetical protein